MCGIGLAEGALKVAPLPVLFPKVENKVIQQELSKLKKMEQEHAKETPEPGPGDLQPTIPFEQFTAVDITGHIGHLRVACKPFLPCRIRKCPLPNQR